MAFCELKKTLLIQLGRGVKACEFSSVSAPDTNTTPNIASELPESWTAHREVFYKTLSLSTTLKERGCSFKSEIHTDSDSDDSCDSASFTGAQILHDEKCNGMLIMKDNFYGRRTIQYAIL